MNSHYDIAVIGAGPAGMAAATTAAEGGARVLLLDEQPHAGGQIYRAVGRQTLSDRNILGPEYYYGEALLSALQASGAECMTDTMVWEVTPQREIGISRTGEARLLSAEQIIIATGAQERPFPVPGWTLPGVMTAGGAQVLLKSSALVTPQAVFAGTGPLLYLVAYQYLKAGVAIRAILDTTPPLNWLRALPQLPAALADVGTLAKGRRWIAALRGAGILLVNGVEDLALAGAQSLEGIEYKHRGHWHRLDTACAFLHQGVVPNVNLAMATGCAHRWSDMQLCWQAVTDDWAQSNMPGIAIAGDGVAIGGARAAESMGRIAAYGALHRCGRLDARRRDRLALPHRRALVRERRSRLFLDRLFRPAPQFRVPANDDTIVCRCEEVTARRVRESVALGCVGPNQLKGFSRCGMGPCQGRMCGLTVSEMIAACRDVPVAEVGALRQRPPVKPLLLGELAALAATSDSAPGSA